MSFQVILSYTQKSATSHDSPGEPLRLSSTGAAELHSEMIGQLSDDIRQNDSGDCCHYSYRIRRIAGMEYHILARSTATGNEAEKRIVHALLLSQEEVALLRASAAHPTPAGLMLALENKLFWRRELPICAAELDEEPTMTASALPDASAHPLWQHYTGRGENARILFTPPYDGGCLLVFPQGMRPEEILGLIHESDWLTEDCGWGRTFTTSGTSLARPSETRRIAVSETYPRQTVPAWDTIPVLRIGPDMVPTTSARTHVSEKNETPPTALTAPPLNYHEDEHHAVCPSTRPPLSRLKRLLIAIGGLLLLSFCINLLVYGKVDDAGVLAGKAIPRNEPPETNVNTPPGTTAPPTVPRGGATTEATGQAGEEAAEVRDKRMEQPLENFNIPAGDKQLRGNFILQEETTDNHEP